MILDLVYIYGSTSRERKTRERTELVQHSVHRGAHIGGLSSQVVKMVWFGKFFSIMHINCTEGRGKVGDCSPNSTLIAEVSYLVVGVAFACCRRAQG
jgi:hypothetical protein